MRVRVIKDGLGNVYKDGTKIHTKVRIMQDDTGRVAVFADKTRNPPVAVYGAGEVTTDRSGGCTTCQGWPPRQVMQKVWQEYEAAHAI